MSKNRTTARLKRPYYIKLSYNLKPGTPQPKGFPPLKCEHHWDIEKGQIANVFALSMASHSGTHVDAPYHVDAAGLRITDFDINEFVFDRPCCIDLKLSDTELIEPKSFMPHYEAIANCDSLLIRTGYSQYRDTHPRRYWQKSPGFSVAGASYLRENFKGLRAIGMDLPSLACIAHIDETMRSHHELLGGKERRFLVIEDMNLDSDLSKLRQVILAPLLVEGADSGPCTIIGVLS